ncbi:MAG: UDP-N-acetylglucosamine 4,6-dehydratase (inverting) [Myxococcales bacterium]|nr:UDP-N-acetylglucosamine 4,6-dehydratase (inverting) [Myxococcales bacterium]
MNVANDSIENRDLAGKAVLITGGTGSFGRAFTRHLLDETKVKKIIVFSRDEQKHYQMSQEFSDPRIRFFVGDIRDKKRLQTAFRDVDVVVHAAAMKHVPICEYNPMEAIQTNIDGARNIVEAAIEAGVKQVLGLSTDKAVAPVNLYGASKLCMEKLLIAANAYSGTRGTRFSLVRYGNVMGSAGSVIPLFRRQLATGKLTITDERMTRFWIDMSGAVQLVRRGLECMYGGEIFIPKLPTSDITTLAEAIAPNVPRETIGIRPGEKLHETLVSADECARTRDLGDLLVIWPEFSFHDGMPKTKDGAMLPAGFVYRSDRPELRLDLEATKAMLKEVA